MDKTEVIESLKASWLFLEGAEKILDLKKGEGYAAAHPEIVAAYMFTASLDFHARIFASAADHHGAMMGDLATSLDRLSGE
ncbi:MAG: hypothetical protein EPO42_07195 [Gallionellaceae bacterium]|nr:MAG: hypothetical protein EPO42_07195 [Gallionellaceae bacterium]